MRILLDSHLLVWLAAMTAKLPKQALPFIDDIDNVLFYSAASLWELSAKYGLGRGDISVHPQYIAPGFAG
jgi:PIN domain nuclease of toxin-antitoxin system